MKWRQYASAYFGVCQIRGKGIGWVDFHGYDEKMLQANWRASNSLIPIRSGVVSLESGAKDWGIRRTFGLGTNQGQPHMKNTWYYVPLMLPLPWRLRSPLSPAGFASMFGLTGVWMRCHGPGFKCALALDACQTMFPSSSHFGSHWTASP